MKINWPVKITTDPYDDDVFYLTIAVAPWFVYILIALVGTIGGFALVDAIGK